MTATDVFSAIKTKTVGICVAADRRRFRRTEDAARKEEDDEKMEGSGGREESRCTQPGLLKRALVATFHISSRGRV